MVPADYRLDQVASTLIARLEGARMSWGISEDRAKATIDRVAQEHLAAVVSEFRENGFVDDPDATEAFLRTELTETVLPRYTELALAHNQRIADGFGLGPAGTAVGQVALGAGSLLVLAMGIRFLAVPGAWLAMLVVAMLPFAPSLVRWWHRRAYEAELQGLLDDAYRIAAAATSYLPGPVD